MTSPQLLLCSKPKEARSGGRAGPWVLERCGEVNKDTDSRPWDRGINLREHSLKICLKKKKKKAA